MLKIRLQRTGRKNDPSFRVVVAEHTVGPKSGKITEKVGSYHPKTKHTVLDSERIKYWLSVGAQATDRVYNMLVAEGIIQGKKRNVLPKKTPIVKEEPVSAEGSDEAGKVEEAAPEAAAEGQEEQEGEVASGEVLAEAVQEEAPQEETKAEEVKKEQAAAKEAGESTEDEPAPEEEKKSE